MFFGLVKKLLDVVQFFHSIQVDKDLRRAGANLAGIAHLRRRYGPLGQAGHRGARQPRLEEVPSIRREEVAVIHQSIPYFTWTFKYLPHRHGQVEGGQPNLPHFLCDLRSLLLKQLIAKESLISVLKRA